MRPPVIIIGMHRSGTTMVARMLEDMGIFLGRYVDVNHEALFFQNLNRWLFRLCGAEWDHPAPVHGLFDNSEVRRLVLERLRFLMHTPRAFFFLGLGGYLRYRSVMHQEEPWGWKDPRNTHLLPLWLELFPSAKVVSIFRHGVDVAYSLKARAEEMLVQAGAKKAVRQARSWGMRRQELFTDSLRCLSLEGGFSLWEECVQEAVDNTTDLKDRLFTVRFEELLDAPTPVLQSLARFCALSCGGETIDRLAGQVRKERAYSYRRDPGLADFAERMAMRLQKMNY